MEPAVVQIWGIYRRLGDDTLRHYGTFLSKESAARCCAELRRCHISYVARAFERPACELEADERCGFFNHEFDSQ